MRILVDANLLISLILAAPRHSTMQEVVELHGQHHSIQIFVGEATLREVRESIQRKPDLTQRVPEATLDRILVSLAEGSILLPDVHTTNVYTRDPDDDYLIELMLRYHLDVLVTGDKHLQSLNGRYGFYVLSPANLLAFVKELL
ncbi:MAG: putative toxin-antitoxin system toxin component, PIN family [Propionibacteriaceae bacterium]|nr:putative toxin-antitoxin system toxin component, PIN family [Propionibacteriaceae bacterium]